MQPGLFVWCTATPASNKLDTPTGVEALWHSFYKTGIHSSPRSRVWTCRPGDMSVGVRPPGRAWAGITLTTLLSCTSRPFVVQLRWSFQALQITGAIAQAWVMSGRHPGTIHAQPPSSAFYGSSTVVLFCSCSSCHREPDPGLCLDSVPKIPLLTVTSLTSPFSFTFRDDLSTGVCTGKSPRQCPFLSHACSVPFGYSCVRPYVLRTF